jgi:putative endonuclease
MAKKKPKHLRTGDRGETVAAWYLRLKGYRILERNFTTRMGEIDIVARKGHLIVFVEVRTRGPSALVDPFSSVDHVKVAKIIQAARCYLSRLDNPLPACRFDLVALTALGPRHTIDHIPGAFDTTTGENILGKRILASRRRRRFSTRRKRIKG